MAELGLEPDASTFTYALQSCSQEGRYDEARYLLDCMKDAGFTPNGDVYRSVLQACEAASPPQVREAIARGGE